MHRRLLLRLLLHLFFRYIEILKILLFLISKAYFIYQYWSVVEIYLIIIIIIIWTIGFLVWEISKNIRKIKSKYTIDNTNIVIYLAFYNYWFIVLNVSNLNFWFKLVHFVLKYLSWLFNLIKRKLLVEKALIRFGGFGIEFQVASQHF